MKDESWREDTEARSEGQNDIKSRGVEICRHVIVLILPAVGIAERRG